MPIDPQPYLSLAGVVGGPAGFRESLAWARSLGFAGVQLDARSMRARELDRSARRDVAAIMRREGMRLSGLDLLIPPEHFGSPAHVGRAVDAAAGAFGLASDLAGFLGEGGTMVVCVVLAPTIAADVVQTLATESERQGVALGDLAWPPAMPSVARAVLDPAAILASGKDPALETSALQPGPVAGRWSDHDGRGRVALGRGTLDLVAYRAALSVRGAMGPMVVDLRELANPEAAARTAISALA